MFEDYFNPYGGVPSGVYIIMQFIDFSFHKKKRKYFTNVDKDLYGSPLRFVSDRIIYTDFIETFKVLFG